MCKDRDAVERSSSRQSLEDFPYKFESLSRCTSNTSEIADFSGDFPRQPSSFDILGIPRHSPRAATFQMCQNFHSSFASSSEPSRSRSEQMILDLCQSLGTERGAIENVGNCEYIYADIETEMDCRAQLGISSGVDEGLGVEAIGNDDRSHLSSGEEELATIGLEIDHGKVEIEEITVSKVNCENLQGVGKFIAEFDAPPGLSRMPSVGSVFKPSFLITPDQESKIQELIGLDFDIPNVYESNDADLYPSIPNDVLTYRRPHPSRQADNGGIILKSKGGTFNNKSFVRGWVPDKDDIELFDSILSVLKTYTLGIKELIGVRQVLRNKFGDMWVNRFNKKLSSKSLLWRYCSNEKRLLDLIKCRAKKFTLVIKNETSMFYLSTPYHVPEGFSVWTPTVMCANESFTPQSNQAENCRLTPTSWGPAKLANSKILQSHDSRVRL